MRMSLKPKLKLSMRVGATSLLLTAAAAQAAQAGDRYRHGDYGQFPAPRHLEQVRFEDGKSEYKYDDGVYKVEEKIDHRAGKYEYKYEGPDGKCEEKYDQGKYEYKCE